VLKLIEAEWVTWKKLNGPSMELTLVGRCKLKGLETRVETASFQILNVRFDNPPSISSFMFYLRPSILAKGAQMEWGDDDEEEVAAATKVAEALPEVTRLTPESRLVVLEKKAFVEVGGVLGKDDLSGLFQILGRELIENKHPTDVESAPAPSLPLLSSPLLLSSSSFALSACLYKHSA
jgi:hypothetical protein